MSLWLQDLKIFIQEKRLTLKILVLLLILLSLLANALYLITLDFSKEASNFNTYKSGNSFTIFSTNENRKI